MAYACDLPAGLFGAIVWKVVDSKAKRGRGCLFYGVVTALVMFLFVLAGALIALHEAKRMLNEFTETKAMPFPSVKLSPSELEKLKDRVTAFQEAVQANQSTPPLSLSADEMNALIASEPQLESWRGRLHVTIESNQLGGLVSLPLEQVGLPIFKGRFLNGNATVTLKLQNGVLWISVANFTVRGKPLPAFFLKKIRSQNLATAVNNDPRASRALEHLQSIRVSEGKLVIEPETE